jgi:hypothetical protein
LCSSFWQRARSQNAAHHHQNAPKDPSVNPEGIESFGPATGCPIPRGLPWVTAFKLHNLEEVQSIPHILFVKCDFVTPQQLPEFILKRGLPMMFVLSGDVISHRPDLGKTNGENAVNQNLCERLWHDARMTEACIDSTLSGLRFLFGIDPG